MIDKIDRRGLTAFVLPFGLYLFTLAPTIYNLDSAELTVAAASGGLMRATGYPLYLLLAKLWTWLPVGDVGYRLNLFSAFNGALTIFLADRILRRMKIGPWPALGALGLLATAPFFWSLSLVAEVYTLHTALMAGMLLLLLRWQENPRPINLASLTLAIGLSMGHHVATVLLLPGVTWYAFSCHARRLLSRSSIGMALAGAAAGLSIYLLLPLRYLGSPAFNYAGTFDAYGQFHPVNLATLSGLWWLISGQSFAAQMFAYRGAALWGEVVWFAGHLGRAFFIVGIGPGLLGLAVLFRKNWRLAAGLLLIFSCTSFFYIDYRVMDKETMFLPSYLVWALWIGAGLQQLLDWAGQPDPAGSKSRSSILLKASLLLIVLLAAVSTGPRVNLSGDWSTRTRGEAILAAAAPDALIIGWWDTVPVIQYLQLVEGQRPDVQVLNRFLISSQDLHALLLREAAVRPVYINDLPASWSTRLGTLPAGALERVVVKRSSGAGGLWP